MLEPSWPRRDTSSAVGEREDEQAEQPPRPDSQARKLVAKTGAVPPSVSFTLPSSASLVLIILWTVVIYVDRMLDTPTDTHPAGKKTYVIPVKSRTRLVRVFTGVESSTGLDIDVSKSEEVVYTFDKRPLRGEKGLCVERGQPD